MPSPSLLETDFLVIGGGIAGVCAAISAARNGAKVVLVQDRSVLGGNASSEVKMHIVGADCHGHRPGTRETGLLEELRLEDAARNPQRCYSLWDLLLYEKVKMEPNITLLLESCCHGCVTETEEGQTRIVSANVIRGVTEEKFVIKARYFADCSGDGRLGAEAGADFFMGREAQSETGEPLALPEGDGKTLGNSILFTARDCGSPQPFVAPSWVRRFEKHEFQYRPLRGFEYGFWWSEWGGQLDTIKDYDAIRHELFRIVLGIWDYIKNSGDHPESANYVLEWFGAIPSKRESRRFMGPHVLVEQDIMEGRVFEDQVAYGGWWLDLHPPTGIDAFEEKPCVQLHIPHLYGIPLRALYSRNISNLFFAGRNISATHVAFASTRVMGTCAVMGQAIGTAAARFLRKPGKSISLAATPEEVRLLQQDLLRDDAFLLGVHKNDPNDLAPKAVCSASREEQDGMASKAIAGASRDVQPEWGPWAGTGSANAWASAELPAWLQLHWHEPVRLSQIHLTFDSGLQRELILSPCDGFAHRIVRGPQPETIRDYDIYIDDQRVISVRGNYLRKCVHRLPVPTSGRRLRVQVLATNGSPLARIFEIRAYSETAPQ